MPAPLTRNEYDRLEEELRRLRPELPHPNPPPEGEGT